MYIGIEASKLKIQFDREAQDNIILWQVGNFK